MKRMLRNFLFLDSSEEEAAYISGVNAATSHFQGNSSREMVPRDSAEAHERLWNDYFSSTPKYNDKTFRRRFRMTRPLFLRIHDAIVTHVPYFVQKQNAAGKWGISSLVKITTVQKILAIGVSPDLFDEYLQIAESTAIKCLMHFVKAVVEVFGPEYLRSPTTEDIQRLLYINEHRGFPGMIGSLDCMHWKWKNCQTGWAGVYCGHIRTPTIILEAVASHDLWIWHTFFGLPDSHNDINVLEYSSLFHNLTQGSAPPVNFTINGHTYNMGYYLTDGIYPQWATFVKTIPHPNNPKTRYFAQIQKAVRKDVERAFGVLQARWNIVCDPVRFHDIKELALIIKACVILHNMIAEDERDTYECTYEASRYLFKNHGPPQFNSERTLDFNRWIENRYRIRNRVVHNQLQEDLVNYLWEKYGASNV